MVEKDVEGDPQKGRRRFIDRDFDEEEVVRASIMFPMHTYDALRNEAFGRRLSIGAVVREAIEFYFEAMEDTREIEGLDEEGLKAYRKEAIKRVKEALKKPIMKESPKKEEILELFEHCRNIGDGFEIKGDQGFIAQVRERGLTGDAWTVRLLAECGRLLRAGYESYWDKLGEHSPKELLKRASTAMKLSKEQRKVLREAFHEIVVEAC